MVDINTVWEIVKDNGNARAAELAAVDRAAAERAARLSAYVAAVSRAERAERAALAAAERAAAAAAAVHAEGIATQKAQKGDAAAVRALFVQFSAVARDSRRELEANAAARARFFARVLSAIARRRAAAIERTRRTYRGMVKARAAAAAARAAAARAAA